MFTLTFILGFCFGSLFTALIFYVAKLFRDYYF